MGSIHAEDAIISDVPDGNGSAEDAPIKTYTDLFNQINETEDGSILN